MAVAAEEYRSHHTPSQWHLWRWPLLATKPQLEQRFSNLVKSCYTFRGPGPSNSNKMIERRVSYVYIYTYVCVCVCLYFCFSMHVVCTRVCVLMCVLMCVAKSSPVIPCASSGPGSIVACFRMVFHSLGLPSTDIHSTSLKDDRILHCPFGTSPCNKSSCIQCICWTLFFHVFFNEYFPHSSEYWRGGYCNCSRVSHVCFSFTVFLVVHEWAVPGPAGVKCLLLWCGLYETDCAA